MRHSVWRQAWVWVSLSGALSCAEKLGDPSRYLSSEDGAPSGSDSGSSSCGDVPTTLLDKRCATAGCHAEANSSNGGLELSSHDFAKLVGAKARAGCKASSELIVDPAEPRNSLLYKVLGKNSPACGSPMPLGASDDSRLTGDEQACVLAWIETLVPRGTPQDGGASPDATSSKPDAGGTVDRGKDATPPLDVSSPVADGGSETSAVDAPVEVEASGPTWLFDTADHAAVVSWKYTVSAPRASWETSAFDDTDWSQGLSGFGSAGTPGGVVSTQWTTPDIWLRKTFAIASSVPTAATLHVDHDEDLDVYINGTRVKQLSGHTDGYIDVDLGPDGLAALQIGTNTIAVHCHQTTGGQYVDVGLLANP